MLASCGLMSGLNEQVTFWHASETSWGGYIPCQSASQIAPASGCLLFAERSGRYEDHGGTKLRSTSDEGCHDARLTSNTNTREFRTAVPYTRTPTSYFYSTPVPNASRTCNVTHRPTVLPHESEELHLTTKSIGSDVVLERPLPIG